MKIKLWQKTKESMWLKTIDGDSPYPDGDKFESMAAQLYPLLKQHFN
ncbi:hypothetical protein [Nostoc favosum]|uniref:Uncharacterized protein n=1 Tax=Nostoc favosum CHAB5714 TaxID=2780399 RepID=A0ABS8IK97_9NOSO|nr:hypothetical protein [Nostoc favosum]MCC5604274.1 hypothetical protein [Nostoc favosum CHAB5714]